MTPYVPSIALKNAIESLFDCPGTAYENLGAGQGGEIQDLDTSEHLLTRLETLRDQLECYVIGMASEAEEYSAPDAIQALQDQACGLLLALRELQKHVPEIARFRHGQG